MFAGGSVMVCDARTGHGAGLEVIHAAAAVSPDKSPGVFRTGQVCGPQKATRYKGQEGASRKARGW